MRTVQEVLAVLPDGQACDSFVDCETIAAAMFRAFNTMRPSQRRAIRDCLWGEPWCSDNEPERECIAGYIVSVLCIHNMA